MPSRKELFQPVIKRGLAWYVEYYIEVDGSIKRVRRRTTHEGIELNSIVDLAEREQIAQQFVKQIRLRLMPQVLAPDQTLFLEALQMAVDLKQSNKAKTNKTFAETARWLSEFFHQRGWQYIKCGAIDLGHIQAYFDHLIVKKRVRNTTHNTRKNNMRSLFSELVQRGYLKENFVKQIPNRLVGDPRRRPLSEQERRIVARYIQEHDRPMWLVYILLGHLAIRPGEIRELRINNIDLRRGLIVFPGEQSKNRRASTVTIPEKLIPEIASYHLEQYPDRYFVLGRAIGRHNVDFRPGPDRIGTNTLGNRFRTILRKLHKSGQLQDIKGLSIYSLKDTLAIRLMDAGVDVESAMRHFRHSSLEMFQRYVKRLGVVNEKIKALDMDL